MIIKKNIYKIYVYKSNNTYANVLYSIDSIIKCKSEHSEDYDKYYTSFICEFDYKKAFSEIPRGNFVITRDCPIKNVICIETKFNQAENTLKTLRNIAIENDLVIYDKQIDEHYNFNVFNKGYFNRAVREHDIREKLFSSVIKPVWTIKKVYTDEKYNSSLFVVTLRYKKGTSFAERVTDFREALTELLLYGEELDRDNGCFKIVADDYSILYSLEGYRNHVNQSGFIKKNGEIVVRPIKRMGTELALEKSRHISKIENKDILSRMYFLEMIKKYPNPADRYAASVKMHKYETKLCFDIRYSNFGYYGSEFMFYVLPWDWDYSRDYSVLKIEEESASFILPIINDIFPYIYERYYQESYLPFQMWSKIIEHIREIKKLILHDQYSEMLKPYIKEFNLFIFEEKTTNEYFEAVKSDPSGIVRKNRYKIAQLYDIFTEWSIKQMEIHSLTGTDTLCIKGP